MNSKITINIDNSYYWGNYNFINSQSSIQLFQNIWFLCPKLIKFVEFAIGLFYKIKCGSQMYQKTETVIQNRNYF